MNVVIPETIEPIIAWIKMHSANAIIGQCGNPDACLLADYLEAIFPDHYFEVQPNSQGDGEVCFIERERFRPSHTCVHDHAEAIVIPLSPALNGLALFFDDLATEDEMTVGGEASMITAGEFLKRWEARQ